MCGCICTTLSLLAVLSTCIHVDECGECSVLIVVGEKLPIDVVRDYYYLLCFSNCALVDKAPETPPETAADAVEDEGQDIESFIATADDTEEVDASSAR